MKSIIRLKETHRKKEYQIWGIVILVAGLLARIWWIRTMPTKQLYDFQTYYQLAVSVFEGNGLSYKGMPIAFQGPLYSLVLGSWFRIWGAATEPLAKWLNVLCSLGTLIFCWKIALILFRNKKNGEKYAIFALGIAAFLPQHIAYCSVTGTETLMGFLLSLFVFLHISSIEVKKKWILIGIISGLCALTKPFYMAYPLVYLVGSWMIEKNIKKAVKGGAVVFLMTALIITPMAIRNFKAFGRFIPVSYNSGFVLYLNNNANNVHGGWMSLDKIYKTPELEEKIKDHLENGKKSVKLASNIELDFKHEAVQWIKTDPVSFLKLGIIRIHSTFFNGSWDIDAWAMNGLAEKPSPLDQVQRTRNRNVFRSINDIFLTVLSVFSFLFLILNIPSAWKAFFSKEKCLSLEKTWLFLNFAFPVAVFFVYEGQPRYNQSFLFMMILIFTINLKSMIQEK